MNSVPGGFGLYVHWPFCISKCPYCDFNSHLIGAVDHAAWRSSLLRELDHYGNITRGRRLETVFFGGGTPSLMLPETTAAVIEALDTYWNVEPNIEITLEANPSSVETQKFADFRSAGVNRVSLGVQSFRDCDLAFLGRSHTGNEAQNAIAIAQHHFNRVSFDLIYALPDQSVKSWAGQLQQALSFDTGHLSLYQLTIEKGTPFFAEHKKGIFRMPDDDLSADLYEKTSELTSESGFCSYEISNYAVLGQESRHNLTYWQGGDYVGVGPGAHGRLTIKGDRFRTEQVSLPMNWLSATAKNGHATRNFELIQKAEHITECLMMGLRMSTGVDRDLFATQTGKELDASIDQSNAAALVSAGLVELDEKGLRTTKLGRLRLNGVIAALVPAFG